jgi:diadenosine tetraphosphate (Ap4A) HIT family hydrolase
MGAPACSLCDSEGGALVYRAEKFRVVRADEVGFAAFYRVIWNTHAAEFSDLAAKDRQLCMEAVVAVELALREQLQPTKINVASLGNMVPHVHWHVIARFAWDSHFPAPVWAQAQRPSPVVPLDAVVSQRGATEALMVQKLQALGA